MQVLLRLEHQQPLHMCCTTTGTAQQDAKLIDLLPVYCLSAVTVNLKHRLNAKRSRVTLSADTAELHNTSTATAGWFGAAS